MFERYPFTYAQIYFPTYSNTLKNVARFLGFEMVQARSVWPESTYVAVGVGKFTRVWHQAEFDDLQR